MKDPKVITIIEVRRLVAKKRRIKVTAKPAAFQPVVIRRRNNDEIRIGGLDV
jgi:hypothetical protein